MNTKAILAIAAFAAVAAGAARADGAEASQSGVVKFEGNRTRAEVQAEAAKVPAAFDPVPLSARVIAPVRSTVDSKQVRSQAAEAVRLGQIPRGETGV